MKYVVAVLVAALLALSFAGCGGETGSDATATISLLVDSTQAMTEVSGYRMSGTISIGSGTGGQSQPINMDIRAEVQNTATGMRQHMFVTIGDYEVEAYIVDGVYYQNQPGQGWAKMSSAAYMSQNMSMGLVDAAQMEMMAQMARGAEVADEDDETVVITFNLDFEYLQASLELYRQYIEEGDEQMPEDWLQMVDSITDFRADISISLNKADNLIKRMEMSYVMAGLPQVGEVSSSMTTDFYDYGADIVVELPPEAAQATEIDLGQ